MNEQDLLKRTKKFAHDCVKLAVQLQKDKLGNHIEGQLIRCSTSVAANYRAACVAQSKKVLLPNWVLLLRKQMSQISG